MIDTTTGSGITLTTTTAEARIDSRLLAKQLGKCQFAQRRGVRLLAGRMQGDTVDEGCRRRRLSGCSSALAATAAATLSGCRGWESQGGHGGTHSCVA